jgi:hypothetical protein
VRGCAEGKGAIARKGMLKEACSVQKHEEAVSHKERYAKGWLHLPSRIAWTHLHILKSSSTPSSCLKHRSPFGTWVEGGTGCEGMNPFAGVCRRLRGLVEDSNCLSSSNPLISQSPHVQVPLRWGMSPPSGLGGGLHLSFILKSSHLPIVSSSSLPALVLVKGCVFGFDQSSLTPLLIVDLYVYRSAFEGLGKGY